MAIDLFPVTVGIRHQPGPRRPRVPAGVPGHEERVRERRVPICRHGV